MTKRTLVATALMAAAPLCFAQIQSTPNSMAPTPMSPGAATPGTPGVTTGSPSIPSTGNFQRPGDTTLPGSATTPGLSTLPGVNERDGASAGATGAPDTLRLPPPTATTPGVLGPAPSSPGVIGGGNRPGCVPGSLSNPC